MSSDPATSRAKRALDLGGAGLLLLLSAPLMAAVALIVWIVEGRPVLFRHERPGLNGRLFTLYKFRTMRDRRDAAGHLRPDGERISPLGRRLRSTSFDELPSLINVVRGEMSLVGPRPLLARYLERYSPEQARRQLVKPGLTGWAQIHGRNTQSWEERLGRDVWYVDHWSFGLDLRILGRTVMTVLRQEGISAPDHATMPEFEGEGCDQSRS